MTIQHHRAGLLVAFAFAFAFGCGSSTPREEAPLSAPDAAKVASTPSDGGLDQASASLASEPEPPHRGPVDVTFAVVSDTHLGHRDGEAKNRALVASLATLEGRTYPKPGLGRVEHLRGLLVAGDLTDWGNPEEWDAFRSIYGIADGGAGSPFPVFEIVGNHDHVRGPWLEQAVARRHDGKAIYTWSFGPIHLVGLGEAASGAALDALALDLAKLPPSRPIVLLVHRPLAGPWSEDIPTAADKTRLAAMLHGRDVVAIFHGHHHAVGHYTWNGIPVFKPGAVKDGDARLAVVHVDDTNLTVATFDWRARRWVAATVLPRHGKLTPPGRGEGQ